ncbi:MAG: hypothetical protein HY762_04805 [Planctomycetes bacterium]|nr:hypothetical protein [Planctomycetota bacterium]
MGIIRNSDVEEATDMPIARYVVHALIQITDYQTELPSIKLQNPDNTKKKEEIIKKWEEWWEQNKKGY